MTLTTNSVFMIIAPTQEPSLVLCMRVCFFIIYININVSSVCEQLYYQKYSSDHQLKGGFRLQILSCWCYGSSNTGVF